MIVEYKCDAAKLFVDKTRHVFINRKLLSHNKDLLITYLFVPNACIMLYVMFHRLPCM